MEKKIMIIFGDPGTEQKNEWQLNWLHANLKFFITPNWKATDFVIVVSTAVVSSAWVPLIAAAVVPYVFIATVAIAEYVFAIVAHYVAVVAAVAATAVADVAAVSAIIVSVIVKPSHTRSFLFAQ